MTRAAASMAIIEIRSLPFHAIFLVLAILPVVLLSKKLAVFVDYGIETLGAPAELGGIIIAILVLSPEGLGALRAALANRLQRSVNILLGSALATIGLTVPAVLAIGLIIDRAVELGLDQVETVLLLSDPHGEHAHLHRRPHQRTAGRGSPGAVPGFPDADLQSLIGPAAGRATRRPSKAAPQAGSSMTLI